VFTITANWTILLNIDSIFEQKIIITANVLSYNIESAKKEKKKKCIGFAIKTMNFLFYNYIFVCI